MAHISRLRRWLAIAAAVAPLVGTTLLVPVSFAQAATTPTMTSAPPNPVIYTPPTSLNRTPVGGPPHESFNAAHSTGGPQAIPALDTANSSTVREPNGTYTTTIYPAPIHYRNAQGQWANISNTLIPSTASGYADQNQANAYQLLLPATAGQPVTVKSGSAQVSFALEGGAVAPLTTGGNTGTYDNVWPGVNLAYTSGNSTVQEAFTIATATDAAALSAVKFAVTVQNATPHTTPQGGVTFTNSSGQTIFSFAAPTLTDSSASAQNGPVTTTLTPTSASTYTLTVTPSQSWLQASTTHYPVVLDPTVNFTGATQDTFLLQNYPTTPYGGTSYINAGYNNGGADHTLLQFSVSAIPAQAQVLDAQLGLYNYTNLTSNATPLSIYAVTQPWSMDTATWGTTNGSTAWTAPGGTVASTAYATTNNLGTSTGWNYWDPTQLVQGWVDGAIPNEGMLLEEPTNSVDNLMHFTSTSSTNSSEWPVLTVNYALRLGQQPYYTMPSQTLHYPGHQHLQREPRFGPPHGGAQECGAQRRPHDVLQQPRHRGV